MQGLELLADTKYTIFLTGAKALNGDNLDHPYAITFSTGSTLPSGVVEGEVTFPGGDPIGSVVAVLGTEFFGDNVAGISIVNSLYEIQYVEDGAYYPLSIKETIKDGEVDDLDLLEVRER